MYHTHPIAIVTCRLRMRTAVEAVACASVMDAPPMSALVRERSPFDEQRGRDREPRERDR